MARGEGRGGDGRERRREEVGRNEKKVKGAERREIERENVCDRKREKEKADIFSPGNELSV